MSLVSICVTTLDRFDLLESCIPDALAKAGHPYELLITDNASTDPRVHSFLWTLQASTMMFNSSNIGYAPAMNQMFLRAKGDYICALDPDMKLPNDWLRILVEHNDAIPNSGLSSYHCVLHLYDEVEVAGKRVHVGEEVFGVKFFHKRILTEIGGFCEDYAPYGLEDNDFCWRLWLSGHLNYYIGGGLKCEHLGNDVGAETPYRAMKWESLYRGHPILERNMARYKTTGDYFVPLPPMD